VLSVKLKVLSKIKELQSLSFALNLNIRLFAVASKYLFWILVSYESLGIAGFA
jgi:hypothetical protein